MQLLDVPPGEKRGGYGIRASEGESRVGGRVMERPTLTFDEASLVLI